MPSSHSFAKFDARPMVKNVITKKSTRKTLVSAVVSLAASRSPGRATTSPSSAAKVTK
jgi:hypothetical protein